MAAVLVLLVLPLALIVGSFFIRPLVGRGPRDPYGAGLAADGAFGRRPDVGFPEEPVVPEDDEARPFKLD